MELMLHHSINIQLVHGIWLVTFSSKIGKSPISYEVPLFVKCDSWSVMTKPATEADVNVAKTPETRAEKARPETSPPLEGASWLRMPIWIPSEPMLPKPQSA